MEEPSCVSGSVMSLSILSNAIFAPRQTYRAALAAWTFQPPEPSQSTLAELHDGFSLASVGDTYSSTAVLYIHGNACDTCDRMMDQMAPLAAAADTRIYAVDPPGYGIVPGRPTFDGWYDAPRKALEQIHTPVVLWGHSLGTAPALKLAALPSVAGVVLESPMVSAFGLAARAAETVLSPWFDQVQNGTAIASVRKPIAIFHGTDDHVVPVDHARRLAVLAPNLRMLRIVEGGKHCGVCMSVRNETAAIIRTMLDEHISALVRTPDGAGTRK